MNGPEVEQIHKPFRKWLDARQIPYRYDRTDKRTRTTRGEPDFLITWMGRCLHIECKIKPNKPSPEQEKRIDYLRSSGNRVEVCYSLDECREAVKKMLCEFPSASPCIWRSTLESIGTDGCKIATTVYTE